MNTHKKATGFKAHIQLWLNKFVNGAYNKHILMGVAVAIVLGVALFGYGMYNRRYEQASFQLFAQNLEEYERMDQSAKKDDWASIALLFKMGYTQYKSSVLAPLFLAYQAQALLKQNNSQEAIVVMDQAVSGMKKSSPVYGLYKAKLALMKVDSADANIHNEGIALLAELAQDSYNKSSDIAAYYLGLHYWDTKDVAKAKETWEKLVNSMKDSTKGVSPWAQQAQAKLAQIS